MVSEQYAITYENHMFWFWWYGEDKTFITIGHYLKCECFRAYSQIDDSVLLKLSCDLQSTMLQHANFGIDPPTNTCSNWGTIRS